MKIVIVVTIYYFVKTEFNKSHERFNKISGTNLTVNTFYLIAPYRNISETGSIMVK